MSMTFPHFHIVTMFTRYGSGHNRGEACKKGALPRKSERRTENPIFLIIILYHACQQDIMNISHYFAEIKNKIFVKKEKFANGKILKIFAMIFEEMGQTQHYNMMMGI